MNASIVKVLVDLMNSEISSQFSSTHVDENRCMINPQNPENFIIKESFQLSRIVIVCGLPMIQAIQMSPTFCPIQRSKIFTSRMETY